MIDTEVPAIRYLNSFKDWVCTGADELWQFLSSVSQNPPTSKAVIVGIVMAIIAIGTLLFVIGLIDLLLRRGRSSTDVPQLSTERFTAHSSGEMVVQITKQKAIDLGLATNIYAKKYIDNVFIESCEKSEIEGKNGKKIKYKRISKAVVKVVFRKRLNFTDDNIAFSEKLESKLTLAEDEPRDTPKNRKGPKVTIIEGNFYRLRQVPWYTLRGLVIRTVLHPDPSTALTYRMFIGSFIISWVLSEAYYERNIMDIQNEKLAAMSAHETAVR
jgi:hypothetical protein